MSASRDRRGITAVDLAIAAGVVGIIGLFLLLGMPRNRETARRATCQRNLMQIGMALGLYQQGTGRLPGVALGGDSPVAAMLDELGQPDFLGLRDRSKRPPRSPGFVLSEKPVRGLICPSDTEASAGRFKAPVSYRASAGDAADGGHGPFSPGQTVTIEGIEAAKGAAFVAAFAERLVGQGAGESAGTSAYASLAGPMDGRACPPFVPSDLRGDAGESWRFADWRSTLYTHALAPDAPLSCIAKDGRSALMGASSAHRAGLNVLMLDGSLRTIRPTVDPVIWAAMGNVGEASR